MFLSVTNYAGVAMEDRVNSTVTSDTRSSIDHLAVRMLTVNAYYDFAAGSVVSPYLGAWVGPAFVTVAGVRFSDEYRDTAVNSDVYDPPLSFYNTSLATRRRRPCRGSASRRSTPPQAYLDRWETRWADTRIHGTTKRQVAAMFAEEQPALGPLPLEPFRYYQYGVRSVHLDGCVEVEAAYYGVPPGWIGPARRRPVEWGDRPGAPPHDRPTAPRASPGAARLASDQRRRPPGADPGQDPRPARGRHARRPLSRDHL